MKLEGGCHCGRVRFAAEADGPYPFLRCYCSICRKTAGGGGYAINLLARAETLAVEGREHLAVYRARMADGSTGEGRRHFCRECGAGLWVFDPRWPALCHPFASAVDTPLPEPPEIVHMMLESKPEWVFVPEGPGHRHFREYPDESLEEWHRRHGLLED